jgi:hypothetical protein
MVEFNLIALIFPLIITLLFNAGLMIILKKHDTEHHQYIYTFFIVSIVIFFLCYSLKSFDLNMGMAIGLFAIFGIIRYRTDALSPQVISYLFASIGIAVINALASVEMGWTELSVINLLVLSSIYLAERFFLKKNVMQVADNKTTKVNLEKCNFVLSLQDKPMNEAIIHSIDDMERKFNTKVHQFKITRIDNETATVQIQLMYEQL